MADILRKKTASFDHRMLSVTQTKISPDLSLVKFYISIYPPQNNETIIQNLRNQNKELRHELACRIKSQLRKVPEINFFIDDSLNYLERIDKLL